MANAIEVKNLKKHFRTKFGFGTKIKAVDDISFGVKEGEIFGFLGPNGAGKSTTIRCLMNFNNPTDGEIFILGENISNHPEKFRSSIGYLPGNVKLYDNWTGYDHIRFYEAVKGKSELVDDLISRLNFNPSAKIRHLSSGNKQKLGLILALMHQPKILIMDEPTVGLDPLLQNKIYEILLDLKKKGSTIFISSHNLPEVERLCDRVAIIKDGKLVAIESIKELGAKKIHKIEVRFADKHTAKEFESKEVEKIEEVSDGLIITVSGDINAVMKKISSHKLVDIEIGHANLEDVFMKFYERKN
jgi:ABC-2 type transport system ATP-binding protein